MSVKFIVLVMVLCRLFAIPADAGEMPEREFEVSRLASQLREINIDDSTLVFIDPRVEAAMALAACNKADSLIDALGYEQPMTRRLAAWALGTMRAPESVDALVARLGDQDEIVRWKAAEALMRIGEPAVESLISALPSFPASAREAAAWTLGMIADARALDALLTLANDQEFGVRTGVAVALGRINNIKALPVLIEMLHDNDHVVARQAAWAAAEFGTPAAEPLAELLDDANAMVREYAVQALVLIGDSDVLVRALNQPDIVTRRRAAETLWRMQSEDQRALKPLLAALSEDCAELRAYAAGALGWLGSAEAVEPLIEALADDDEFVRGMAIDSLGKVADERAVALLAALMKKEPPSMRRKIVAALGNMGLAAFDPLVDALLDESPVVRETAVLSLGRTGDERAIPPLRQAMDDIQADMPSDWAGFFNVIRTFPKAFAYMQGNPRAVEALLELLARSFGANETYRWNDGILQSDTLAALTAVTGQHQPLPPLIGIANLEWWRKWWVDCDGIIPESAAPALADLMASGMLLYQRKTPSAHYRSKIDFAAAREEFQRALALADNEAEQAQAMLALVENMLNDCSQKDYGDIRQIFAQVLEFETIRDTDRARALLGIGQTWLRENEYVKARDFFEQASALDSSSAWQNTITLQRGMSCLQERRYEDALLLLEPLVRNHPNARQGTAWEARALLVALNQAPMITPGHPRLFFNAESWPAIKERALTSERASYEAMREQVKALDMELITAQPDDWGMQAMAAAFVYRVDQDMMMLEKALALLRSAIDFYLTNNIANTRSHSAIASLAALDWLWNDITPTERVKMADDMLDYAHTMYVEDVIQDQRRSGHVSYYVKSVFWFAGVGLLDPELDNTAHVRALQALGAGIVGQRFPDNPGKPDGAVDRRPDYYFNAVLDMIWPYFYIYESALGRSVPADWIYIMTPDYILRSILPMPAEPGTGRIHHFNFSNSWKHKDGMRCINLYDHIGQLIHFFGESHPQQAAIARTVRERMENKQMAGIEPRSLFSVYPFLRNLEKVQPVVIPENMPIARHFAHIEQILMSSGFTPDDTYAAFILKGTTKYKDGTHFTIFRNGYLALDSGTRAQGNWYYRASIAHNLVLISMSPETLEKHDDWPLNLKTGGQINPYAVELKAFESTPYYAYMATDATRAYHEDACALMTRQFVFLPPNHFVVFDRVTSTKAEYPKTWLLHTANEPAIDEKEFFADQGMGRIFCRTLLPDDAVLEPVGGPGREFLAAGRNWPIPENSPYLKTIGTDSADNIPETIGRWRVEVKPGQERVEDFFLHLIMTTDQTVSVMTKSELIEDAERAGIRFAAGDKNITLEFNRTGAIGGRIKIEDNGETVVDRELTQEVMQQAGLALIKME